MANRIETATLRMLLQDDVSANAGKVAAAVKGMAGAEAGLVKESERLAGATKKLGEFDKLRQTFNASRGAFNEARTNVQKLATEMRNTEAPTAKMRREFERAKKEVSATAATFEKQKTRLVETKQAFEALAGGPLRSVANAQATIRRETEETTAAIRAQVKAATDAATREAALAKQRQAAPVRHSGGSHGDTSTIGGLANLYVAHEFEEGARRAIEQYREFDKERRYGGVVMGLDYQQQKPLIDQAIHGGGTSKFNDIQWLESQRELSARGYFKDQVLAFTPVAKDLAQALDVSMPEAVKALEGSLLGFGKDTSTFDKSVAAARRTADLEVKASKISGASFEDIVSLYKYAAAPARMAGLSEESMLAFGAISKKSNLGGDEAGTAFRALVKNLISPTAGARTAMSAAGINFGNYQAAPKAMNLPGFVSEVARRYGVQLDASTQAGLGRLFADKGLTADASRFTPAVTQLLKGSLGGNDAKSLKSIAGLARSYRDDSTGKVDVNRLMTDLMGKMAANPALANSIFGSKAGGKIFTALGDPAFFKKILGELRNESQGYAGKVSDARMAGFDGAVSRLQGSVLNLEGAFGRAFDNNGQGGFLTNATQAAAAFTQALAEADPNILRMAGTAAAAAAAVAGLKGLGWVKGGFGLQASATHLDEAALALKEAAGLQGGHATPGAPGEAVKPGVPEGVPKGGILGGAGFKGLATGLSEGVVGAAVFEAGKNAIHLFEDHVLGWTAADRKRIDAIDPWKDSYTGAADKFLGDRLGKVTDKTTGPDPYLSGERPAIDERARRSAAEFRRSPEAARGRAMMERFGLLPVTPAAAPPAALLPVPAPTPVEPEETGQAPAEARTAAETALLRAAGKLPRFAEGGHVSGSGGPRSDAILAHLSHGEFVINTASTARHLGLLHAINDGRMGASGSTPNGAISISLRSDPDAADRVLKAITQGTYKGFRRAVEQNMLGGGDGGGSGGVNLRYGRGGDGGRGGNTPNLRYGGHGVGHGGGRYRDTPGADRPSPDSGRSTHVRGALAANQKEGYAAALAEGLSPTAARALVADMSGESLANPRDHHWDRSHMSGGIAQWDPARSAAIKAQFGKNPWELSVADQTRAAVWEIRNNRAYAATNHALQGNDPNGMIGALVRNYENPLDKEGAIRTRLGYLHGFNPANIDSAQRAAESPLLPRKKPATAGAIAPEADATPTVDHSSIREALHHTRELKRELASIGTAHVDVKHSGFGSRGAHAPGAIRTALNGNFTSDGRAYS